MIIKDPNGMYTFNIDKNRRIVKEEIVGSWSAEDYERYSNEFPVKIIPYLGKGAWAKIILMTQYKPSTKVTPEQMNAHSKWAAENGFKCAAIILDSATLKMQLNRGTKDVIGMGYFDNDKDADRWLQEQGF